MILEHVFTSLPKGLNPGSRGFSTAAATQGMSPPLVQLSESLSGYTHIFPLQSPDYVKNPVAFSHYRLTVGGKSYHVLSRVAALPADYSGRTNKIAHHLLVPPSDTTPAGPAAELSVPGRFLSNWTEEPRYLPEGRVSMAERPAPSCAAAAWRQAAGDAGWAGVLARHWLSRPDGAAYVVFAPGQDLLPLFDEALRLIPPERRWEVTFSTYLTTPPAGTPCRWRGCLPDNPLLRAAAKQSGTLVIDLTRPGAVPAEAETDPLVRSARTGEPPEWTDAERHPPAPVRQTRTAETPVETAAGAQPQPQGPRRITSVKPVANPKKHIPLWIPPVAAIVSGCIGYAIIQMTGKPPASDGTVPDLASDDYACVTNFILNCDGKTNEISKSISEIDDLTCRFANITKRHEYAECTNLFYEATNQYARLSLSAPDTNMLHYAKAIDSLKSLTNQVALSNHVKTCWNEVTNDMNTWEERKSVLDKTKCKAQEYVENLKPKPKEQQSGGSTNQTSGQSNPTNKLDEMIRDLTTSSPIQGKNEASIRNGLVLSSEVSNLLARIAMYTECTNLINDARNKGFTNEISLWEDVLKGAWQPFKQPIEEILNAKAERVNAHPDNAADLGEEKYRFPPNEKPEVIYLYDRNLKKLAATNAPTPFKFGSDFFLADVLAITTVRDGKPHWHLFAQPPLLQVTISDKDWDRDDEKNDGFYTLICKSASPLYALLSGVAAPPVALTNLVLSSHKNAALNVRKTKTAPGSVSKQSLPELERVQVIVKVPLENVKGSKDVKKSPSDPIKSNSLYWNNIVAQRKAFEDYVCNVPTSYKPIFADVLTRITKFNGKGDDGKELKPKEKDKQIVAIKKDWESADEKMRTQAKSNEDDEIRGAKRKEVDDEFGTRGFTFNLAPVLKELGWRLSR
jgi:hypothetical protein